MHDKTTLSDVQKFNYLKSQLYEEASQCIAGLQIINTNYGQAIHILVQSFGQEHKIVNAYMQNLFNLTSPTSGRNGLKVFYDTAESYIPGLEAIGKPQESYGSMLVPIILGKLPGNIRQNITRDRGNDDWALCSLREALRREICIQEAGQEVSSNNGVHEFTPTSAFVANAKRNANVAASDSKDLTRKPCVYCTEIHAPSNCTKVKSVEDRKRIIKKKKLCFNCLGSHRVAQCQSRKVCKNCRKRHHTSICMNEQQTETQVKTKTDDRNFGKSDANASVTTMHSGTSSVRREVLLKTAITPVSAIQRAFIDGHVLFDEGAQRSFITEELAGKLNIVSTGEEKIAISGFGQNETSMRNLQTAKLYVQGETREMIPIVVLIIPNIANPVRTQRNVATRLTYLKGLKLAHPVTSNEDFEISLLIGADFYWDFIEVTDRQR